MTKFLTPEGLKKLEDELGMRKTEMRQKIAATIKADNERRIMELENTIRTSEVASFVKGSNVVQMGSKVKVKFNGDEQIFEIVGSNEADPLIWKISNESPIGKVLLGKKAGDKVKAGTPSGEKEYKIIEVK